MHALFAVDGRGIKQSAANALSELSAFDGQEGRMEAAKALREAVKTALRNQALIGEALVRLKEQFDREENVERSSGRSF